MMTTLAGLDELAAPGTCRRGPHHLTLASPRRAGGVGTRTIPIAKCAAAAMRALPHERLSQTGALEPDALPGEYLPAAIARRLHTASSAGPTPDIIELRRRALKAVTAHPDLSHSSVLSYIGLDPTPHHPVGAEELARREQAHQLIADRIDQLVSAAGFTF